MVPNILCRPDQTRENTALKIHSLTMLKKWIKVRTISLHICQHCLWIWTGGPWSDMYVLFTCWGWGVRSCVCVWVCERSEGAGVRAGICLPRLLRAVTVWCDVRCRPVLTPRRHTVLLWRTFSSVTHGTVCRDVLRVWRKTILGQLTTMWNQPVYYPGLNCWFISLSRSTKSGQLEWVC